MGLEKKEYFAAKMRVKAAEEEGNTGYLEGFCSVFSSVDQGWDVVHPGAFAATIQAKNGVFPFLLDHKRDKPAGYSTEMKEESKGLYYKAEFPLHDPEVKQRFELAKLSLRLKSPMANSFGYCAVKYDYEERESADGGLMLVRNLREVKLFEGSLVTFGMHEEAGVTGAKSAAFLQVLDMIRKGEHSLEEMQVALASLPRKEKQAADDEADPELLQSVRAFAKVFA